MYRKIVNPIVLPKKMYLLRYQKIQLKRKQSKFNSNRTKKNLKQSEKFVLLKQSNFIFIEIIKSNKTKKIKFLILTIQVSLNIKQIIPNNLIPKKLFSLHLNNMILNVCFEISKLGMFDCNENMLFKTRLCLIEVKIDYSQNKTIQNSLFFI